MKKKKLAFLLIVFILLIPIGLTFGKYITENIKNYIMEANNFFFNSDKLVAGGIDYEINNWGGASNIEIQFELNNHKNNILTSQADITYSLATTCDESVICSLSSSSGTIYRDEQIDTFSLSIVPQRSFADNESIEVSVSATSSSPYVKTLSATYIITVGRRGIDYEITDSVNSPYLLYKITNALDTYQVLEAFNGYSVGDILTTNDYVSLSATNKAKCASALITLSFNPAVVVIDTTSNILDNATITTTLYNGVDYISSVTFPVDILSSTEVRFYKRNVSSNYTYTGSGTPIISFSAL